MAAASASCSTAASMFPSRIDAIPNPGSGRNGRPGRRRQCRGTCSLPPRSGPRRTELEPRLLECWATTAGQRRHGPAAGQPPPGCRSSAGPSHAGTSRRRLRRARDPGRESRARHHAQRPRHLRSSASSHAANIRCPACLPPPPPLLAEKKTATASSCRRFAHCGTTPRGCRASPR